MNLEEKIIQDLLGKFNYLEGKIKFPRPRRLFIEVSEEKLFDVLQYLHDELKFAQLCTITGLDEGPLLGVMYHLAQNSGGLVLSVKTVVQRDTPVIKTVTNIYPAAEIYERELADLLGFKVEGLGQGLRYPLPDDWPVGQYPLRKDWKAEKK
jgi:membrane-bound hydrogenase subunit beta